MTVAVPAVYKAIATITGDLAKHGISKDKQNQQQGYKFRGIDDVYNALAPKLAEVGLIIVPKVLERVVEVRETRNGGALYNVALKVEFSFIAASDGSREVITMYGEAMDSGDKATNKALSAAFKYACIQSFCIPTEGEDDADRVTPEETVRSAKSDAEFLADGEGHLASYQDHKKRFAIEPSILPNGQINYDEFGAALETAVLGATSMHDVSMLKKANAKTLNSMKADRPEMFEALKTEFTKHSNRFA